MPRSAMGSSEIGRDDLSNIHLSLGSIMDEINQTLSSPTFRKITPPELDRPRSLSRTPTPPKSRSKDHSEEKSEHCALLHWVYTKTITSWNLWRQATEDRPSSVKWTGTMRKAIAKWMLVILLSFLAFISNVFNSFQSISTQSQPQPGPIPNPS